VAKQTQTRGWRATAALARWLTPRRLELAAIILIAGGIGLRLALAALGWPATDSDEATFGLMALHISERGAHPIFFYGQNYMGAVEAYLAAGAFRLFGPSLFALRLSTIALSAGFLVCVYLLTRLLYGRGLALATLALLAIGSHVALLLQVFTNGGYADTLFFGALLLLLATLLARPENGALAQRRWRLLAYGAWGLAAGLGLWSDVLILPFILTSALLLLAVRWRELLRGMGAAVVVGLVIGALPLITFAAAGNNPFQGAAAVQQAPNATQGGALALYAGQVAGTFLVSLPEITGGAALCPISRAESWPLAHASQAALACTTVHGLWCLGYLALLGSALVVGARACRAAWLHMRRNELGTNERAQLVIPMARFALALSAALTLALYISSPVAARAPQAVMRYLIGLTLATPVLLAPLWRRATSNAGRGAWMGGLALGVVALAYLLGLASVFQAIPDARAEAQRQERLIASLDQLGVTAIYTDYWTCDRLAFTSHERIVCATLNPDLQPDLDRYAPYRERVVATPDPTYLFPADTAQARSFQAVYDRAPAAFQRVALDGYILYLPATNHPRKQAASNTPHLKNSGVT
jgi:4-amino-4-deoxy-L-arabinose transferase-like glycosyltransferase